MVILNEIEEGSSSTRDHKYDVFLSFRGADTRLSFTNHLHTALENANLTIFYDDEEIKTGEELKPKLESKIKASKASIVVLSKNYASSRWCLDELVLILAQHRDFKQIVIPIFYHVEPTHVRNQQGSFGDAMVGHNQRMEAETNAEKKSEWARKIELWKKALKEVADLKGHNAHGRLETKFIEEIVNDIYQRIGLPIISDLPLLIGMKNSIKFISSWFKDRSSQTGDVLTIFGIGGIGKTSLAKYVYMLHCHEFNESSFIVDISRRCGKLNGLLDVQKQLCHEILKTSSIQVHDVSEYTSMIKNALARKKVLIVLDDIDNLDQLDALLGNKGFHPGSKIIITTKDASLKKWCALLNPQVQPTHTTHLLEGLSETASQELLYLNGFKCEDSKEDHEEVSYNIVKYCGGHPLALKVLGRCLCNEDVAYWKDYIKELKREPNFDMIKVLKMSFDTLPSRNDREIFKHIACFFIGVDRDYAETILEACDINTKTGITHLIDRCLLNMASGNVLMMHSLIQEMGRDLVRQESPDHLEKRSRLWHHEDSFEVLKKKKGTENIKGLVLDMRMLEKQRLRFELKTKALNNMDKLMILHLNYVQLSGSYENFPEELRWLCMHGFPLKSIPSDLPMEYLVVLDMSYSNIESFGMSDSNPKPNVKRQKMYYEFGIFSTVYGGEEEEMPNWIEDRREGPSISFTIPSSPNRRLKGLNFCNVQTIPIEDWNSGFREERFGYPVDQLFYLPLIKISNITKNRTWIYRHFITNTVNVGGNWLTFISHWMFGMDEMEAGDQVIVTVSHDDGRSEIKTCGMSFVYEDRNNEQEGEDVLGYYKSWNHIIGGDLSPFQFTTGEYLLNKYRFFGHNDLRDNPFIEEGTYKEPNINFKALSQSKSNVPGRAIEDVTK